jgi:hypothetical protein
VSNPTGPRWLIVVQDLELAEAFRERFGRLGIVVVLDRRRAERRRQGGAAQGIERRETDRRQRKAVAWVYPAQLSDMLGPDIGQLELGAAPTPLPVGLGTETCPTCAIALEFQMPRFDPPAAGIETTVVHHTDQTFGVQHYVEVRAFGESGSPVLKRRVQAQRRTPRREEPR